MTPEEINERLRAIVIEGAVAVNRYQAAKLAFDAACLEENGHEADKHRAELHALLDVMLDGSSSTLSLTKLLFNE